MIDRNPQGRDTGAEGVADAVRDRNAEDILLSIERQLKLLRLSLLLPDHAADLGDNEDLTAERDF